ncbi:carbohydrate sulfotransferase 10-like [Anneissia japonica]|uniref:carbohydrate sulfotransferase 10-like n=1 Tax=Anneissia japonica TaxID=1529436 RepID=UPI001425524B|nr:carbohydrate sulfotransferase 10-like [Anneissia japonica]
MRPSTDNRLIGRQLEIESNRRGTTQTPQLQEEVEGKMAKDTFMEKYSAKIRKRVNHTRNMCRKHKNIQKMKEYPTLLVNEEHKLVYCQTPKVGTVSWCKIFLQLSGYKNRSELMNMNVIQVSAAWKKHVPRLSDFPAAKQKEILANYTKIMFVRNPLTRLLSAYNDKLVLKSSSDRQPYYQNTVNKRILAFFRIGGGKKRNYATFREFVRMLISKQHYIADVHWSPMHSVCFPCSIDYDVIGQLEDIENESNYILRHVGADIEFPHSTGTHFTNSSSYEKVIKSYATIPRFDLLNLYQKYKYDFLLFDYNQSLAML